MDHQELKQLELLSREELIAQFGSSHYNRQQAICAALRTYGAEVHNALIAGLSDKRAYIRKSCADLLDMLGDDRAIEPLLATTNDPVASVRQVAVHALSCDQCKSQPLAIDMVPILKQLALSDPSVNVRTHAVIALKARAAAARSDESLIPLLTKLAIEDPSVKVRHQAVGYLGFYAPNPTVVPAIAQVISELTAKSKLSKRERSLLFVARRTHRHHQKEDQQGASHV